MNWRLMLKAISIGFIAALAVGVMKLVDSAHAEPPRVVLGFMAATALWVAWLLAMQYLQRRRAG